MSDEIPLRYSSGEIAFLDDMDQDTADWTLISWDLSTRSSVLGSDDVCGQFILGPGVLVTRYGTGDSGVFERASPRVGYSLKSIHDLTETPADTAFRNTQKFEETGATWGQRPFVIDLHNHLLRNVLQSCNPDWVGGHTITTAGDALYHGSHELLSIIFKHVNSERSKLS